MGHGGVVVPVGVAVTPYFAPDGDPVAPDLATDRGVAKPGVAAPHDDDALIQTQSMTLTARPRHVPGIGDPAASTSN
jgi:hypothetical protein